jgi:hypothetical protein
VRGWLLCERPPRRLQKTYACVRLNAHARADTHSTHATLQPYTRTRRAQEGARAFYKGWLPSVIGVVPYVGLNFGVYETAKVVMMRGRGEREGGREGVGGACELSVLCRVLCCVDISLSAQSSPDPHDTSPPQNNRKTHTQKRPQHRNNTTKPKKTKQVMLLKSYGLRDERELSVGARLACGALAGTTGQTVAYPFDVARRRLQVSGWQGARELHSDHGSVVSYRGMTDCFVRTVREEGFGALFKVRACVCVFGAAYCCSLCVCVCWCVCRSTADGCW